MSVSLRRPLVVGPFRSRYARDPFQRNQAKIAGHGLAREGMELVPGNNIRRRVQVGDAADRIEVAVDRCTQQRAVVDAMFLKVLPCLSVVILLRDGEAYRRNDNPNADQDRGRRHTEWPRTGDTLCGARQHRQPMP